MNVTVCAAPDVHLIVHLILMTCIRISAISSQQGGYPVAAVYAVSGRASLGVVVQKRNISIVDVSGIRHEVGRLGIASSRLGNAVPRIGIVRVGVALCPV